MLGYQLTDASFCWRRDEVSASPPLHLQRGRRAVHAGAVLAFPTRKRAPRPTRPADPGRPHTYLCRQGLATVSLIVQASDVQEGHDICCLVGFGADSVHPYLMLRLIKNGLTFKEADTKQEVTISAHECLENLFAALEDSIKKIIAKMGITTIEGYRGAQLFEAVGFGPELMEFLGDFPSRIGGIGLKELVVAAQWRVEAADKMTVLGRNRDYMAFNPKVPMALRYSVK